jgi:hypothetical protein
MESLKPIVRNLLRYGAGALIARGTISADFGSVLLSPEIIDLVAGTVILLGTEVWYKVAKKSGGAT